MAKLMWAVFVCSVLATVVHAQEIPVADLAVGYSMLFLPKGFTLTLHGGSGAVALNVNHWLGVVGDFGGYNGSLGIPGLIAETYTVGPRFCYRKWNRLTPFAQALIGGAHANTTNGGFLGARNAFAIGAGVGGDLGLDRTGKFALRGQMEGLNFRTGGINTGALRLSTGVALRIGRRQ
jgi:hypothetical protein